MSDDHGNRKERRSSFFIATFYTVAACIYLWIWLFNGLDMGSGWVGPFGSILFGVCAIMSWLWHVKTLPPATGLHLSLDMAIQRPRHGVGLGWTFRINPVRGLRNYELAVARENTAARYAREDHACDRLGGHGHRLWLDHSWRDDGSGSIVPARASLAGVW